MVNPLLVRFAPEYTFDYHNQRLNLSPQLASETFAPNPQLTSLKEVVEKYHPDRIIIEPSGVGKLSDVIKAVKDLHIENEIRLNSASTVADASKVKVYMKNFGEFFNNQIEHAGTIILSRTQNVSEAKLKTDIELIRSLNKDAHIITTPWDDIDGKQILDAMENVTNLELEIGRVHLHRKEDKWRVCPL